MSYRNRRIIGPVRRVDLQRTFDLTDTIEIAHLVAK